MLYIFMAVLAVLLVMNVFMVFVLRQMTAATGKQIEKDAGRLFAVYDEMLEAKSQRLEELRQEEEAFLARTGGHPAAEIPVSEKPRGKRPAVPAPPVSQADFQDSDFSMLYGKIKSTFSMEKDAFAEAFWKNLPPETGEEARRRSALERMRSLLDFEHLYQISLLPVSQQKEVLRAAFSGEEGEIYQEWEADGAGSGVMGFSDWLDFALQSAGRNLVVKTSPAGCERNGQDSAAAAGKDGISWQEDDSICEGMKILYQNRLYDYSI